MGFQCDGSLAVSCGLDAIGRVWDLHRQVREDSEGHVDAVLSAEFAERPPRATGSDDHTCKIWDLGWGRTR